jgi:hypothetical protein
MPDRPPLRDAERAWRQRRPGPGRQRLHLRGGRRQHAFLFLGKRILFGPGKAANAGGVSVSGLEMTQNSMRLQWTNDKVDKLPARDHEGHPQPVCPLRRPGRPHQLCGWREHRRLPQSRRGDAGPRVGLSAEANAPPDVDSSLAAGRKAKRCKRKPQMNTDKHRFRGPNGISAQGRAVSISSYLYLSVTIRDHMEL